MAVAGSLQTMNLPDLLGWIKYSSKSGTLFLKRSGYEKKLHVDGGFLVSVTTNDPAEYLGQVLMGMGLISESDLADAFQKQQQSGHLLGRILLEEYEVQPDQLELALETKVQETLYNLFLWDGGVFRFTEAVESLREHERLTAKKSIESLLLEGARRADTWKLLMKTFPSKFSVVRLKGDPGDARVDYPNTLLRNYIAPRVVTCLEAPKTIDALTFETHASRYMVYEALWVLHQAGQVEVNTPQGAVADEEALRGAGISVTSSGVDEIFKTAQQLFQAQNYEGAIEALEDVLLIDETHSSAQKLLETARMKFNKTSDEILPKTAVLEVVGDVNKSLEQIRSNEEGFLVSRINGEWDVRSILMISPFGEFESTKILRDLLKRGVVRIKS